MSNHISEIVYKDTLYECTKHEVPENKPYGADCAAIEAAISVALRRRELELKNGGGKCKIH